MDRTITRDPTAVFLTVIGTDGNYHGVEKLKSPY